MGHAGVQASSRGSRPRRAAVVGRSVALRHPHARSRADAETFFKGRIATFDVGAIAKIRSGAIRVIDGNVRLLEGFAENGVLLGGSAVPFDNVILATGFEPRIEEFIADAELLGPVHQWDRYPLTDNRCRSRIHPSIFFPGFDRTPLGGHSLGRWGWEVGERIAEALRSETVAQLG